MKNVATDGNSTSGESNIRSPSANPPPSPPPSPALSSPPEMALSVGTELHLPGSIPNNDCPADVYRDRNFERDPTVISQGLVAAPVDFAKSMSLVALSRSLEGRQLDHFSVERMIGGGGMGAVFRGRDQRLDREVAIKVIPESRRDAETLRRFRMEAQSAARLDHPNIARVYDIGEDEAWNYIVFEFIDGINLRDLVLNEGPMNIDDAVFTTRQVAEALQHADERGVVHRDIKPSNVIITPTGIAKVVDMGLARNTAMDRSTADQTASGVTLGTFDYISPEQARDPRDADVRSDLYSLGCSLYYMLTGQPPFPDGTALQKLLNHGSQPPPDPRQWREDISDELYAVLAKLMAKRPADRYQKPHELINDLMLIAQVEQLPRSGSPGTILLSPAIAQRSFLETHLPWVVPSVGLLLSAFWLQSFDSLAAPLELPKPNFRAPDIGLGLTPPTPPPTNLPSAQSASTPPSLNGAPLSLSGPTLSSEGASSVFPSANSSLIGGNLNSSTPANPSNSNAAAAPLGGSGTAGPVEPPSDAIRKENAVRPDGVSRLDNLPRSEPPPQSNTPSPLAPAPARPDVAFDPVRPAESGLPANSNIDTIRLGGSQASAAALGQLWANSLQAALMLAATAPEVRTIELSESIEVSQSLSIPRSGLTLRAEPGKVIDVVLTGEQSFGMGWEAWIDVQGFDLRCERLQFHCRNDMRQPQAFFGLRVGGQLALDACRATMDSDRDSPLGSCIVINEPDRVREASALGADGLPVAISIRGSIICGNQTLVTMRAACRAEFTIEESCAILEGRGLTIRSIELERIPPVVRWNMERTTLVARQGFAAIQSGFAQRPPLTLMRTARQCAFWSPSLVPHLVVDGVANDELLEGMLQLRGEENAYDQNIETLCQCRLADGRQIDFSFRDATGEWFRERGNDNTLRWQNPVPPDRPMEEQLPENYRLRQSLFMPGFPQANSAAPPHLDVGPKY